MTKRLISLFLALIMVVGVLPCTVFAVEPKPEKQAFDAKKPDIGSMTDTGAKKLTIVNDTVSPALFTVKLTRDKVEYVGTKMLFASETNCNMWEIPIDKGDEYEVVEVKYPDYFDTSSDVNSTISCDSLVIEGEPDRHSYEFFGGKQIAGSDINVPGEVHKIYTVDAKDPTKHIYWDTVSDAKYETDVATCTDVNSPCYGKTAVWKTFSKWTASAPGNSTTAAPYVQYQAKFGTKDGTTTGTKPNDINSDLTFFAASVAPLDSSRRYKVDISDSATYPNSSEKMFTNTEIYGAISSTESQTFVGKKVSTVPKAGLAAKYQLARQEKSAEVLIDFVKTTLKNNGKNADSFTFVNTITYDTSNNGAFNETVKPNTTDNNIFVYQLVEATNPTIGCGFDNITLTYTIPTTMIATQTALDVVNADRFTAIHENLNTEWLGKVLDKLKQTGYTSADLKDHPERIIEVVGLDTLTAVFGAETMPKPDSITLAEVEENNNFYQGNTYTLTAASDSDLIKPLYAELQLPEFVLQALTKDNINAILNLAVISPKGSKISEYEKEQTELNNSTTKLLNEDAELNLASNSTWKSNVKSKTDGFDSFVKTKIGEAKAAYNKINASASDLSMALAQIIKELNGTKLPIQLGYTFNFAGVQPGRYKVTFDGMASWSDLKADRIITVKADGTVDYGQEPQDMVTLDFVADETVWDKFCDQLIGDNFDHDALGALIKILLFGKDKDGKNTVAPALFTSNGVWLGTEGGPGSMAFGTNTIEFTAVEADGVTPLEGATYMLINRDQLMQLMQTMIGLGKVAVDAVNGDVSFDELMETYQEMLQAGDVKSLTGDLSSKLGQFVPALLNTVMALPNFSELDLPLIFEATSDENGLVRFGAAEENTIKGVMELGGLTMNTAKDVAGNVVSIINDDIIGTITKQLNDVKSRVGEINVSYKAALERVDAAKKSINNTVSAIRNDINTMRNTVSGFFTNVRNWLKSFFGIVTRADAIEFNTSTIQTVNTLLDKLSADQEVIDMIVDLLGKAGTIMGITNDLSTLDSSLNAIKSKEADWDKYVNDNGWKDSKPGKPEDPKNKLEEFMDQLEKKIKELNDTAKSVKETAGKLDRPTEILNYLGKQGDDLYDVAYGLLDLLGVAIEGDDRFPDGNYILMQIAAPDGYTRSNVCYTLHVENGRTTAQRGILTPLLETNSKALEAYVASLSDVNKAKLAKFQKDADSYLDRQAKLWDAMNYFSMTRVIANGVRDSIIADVAEAVFKAMPGCFVDVDAVELEIRTALKQVDSNPTFDELLKIADKMITKSTATVGRGWTVIAAVNVPTVDPIPA